MRSACILKSSPPSCARGSCPARRRSRSRAISTAFAAAVPVFGRGQVSTYILAGTRRHQGNDPRHLREADRARRLSVRRAVRADLGHAAGKSPGAVAGLHARDSRDRWRGCCGPADCGRPTSKPAAANAAPVRRCRPMSGRLSHDLRSVSRCSCRRNIASSSQPKRGSAAKPPRCGVRYSATSRAFSRATIATRSTMWRSRSSRSPRSAWCRRKSSARSVSMRPSRESGGARASRSPPITAGSARSALR